MGLGTQYLLYKKTKLHLFLLNKWQVAWTKSRSPSISVHCVSVSELPRKPERSATLGGTTLCSRSKDAGPDGLRQQAPAPRASSPLLAAVTGPPTCTHASDTKEQRTCPLRAGDKFSRVVDQVACVAYAYAEQRRQRFCERKIHLHTRC